MKFFALIILMLSVLLAGCDAPNHTAAEAVEAAPVYDPIIMPEDFIACIVKVGQIQYLPDKMGQDSWQSPEETARLGRGDCEDIAIYFQDLLKQKGYPSEVVFGLRHRYAKTGHCWVEVMIDGELYICEPRGNAFLKRSKTHKWRYIRAEDIDVVKEKVRRYHDRTGVYVNSKYGRAIEAEKNEK